jgi:hypothetical protein
MDNESSSSNSIPSNWWYYNYRYYIDNPTTDYSTDREYVEDAAANIQKQWKRYRAAKSKVARVKGNHRRRKKRAILHRAKKKRA